MWELKFTSAFFVHQRYPLIIMNKGGIGLGSGGGGGPTAAAAVAAAQKQKTLLQKVDADIGNIVDNFTFLVNVARVTFFL